MPVNLAQNNVVSRQINVDNTYSIKNRNILKNIQQNNQPAKNVDSNTNSFRDLRAEVTDIRRNPRNYSVSRDRENISSKE